MKILFATVTAALALAGGVAQASGPVAPVQQPPMVLPATPPAYDWSGAYAGLGLTYGRMGMDTNGALPSYPDASGAGLSAIAGYNWQNGNVVYGAEAALDFSNRSGSNDCGMGGQTCDSHVRNQASIRGRLGYAMDRSLMFMTLGYASDARSVNTTLGNDTARFTGPVLGVGYEQAMGGGDWRVRGDFEHYFYGNETLNGVSTNGAGNLFRLSLIRRF